MQRFSIVATLILPTVLFAVRPARCDTVELHPTKDASLFEYDPIEEKFDVLRGNSKGDFIAVGRSKSNDQIQRGLIQFDFNAVPANAVITEVSLELRLIDVAVNAENDVVSFWLEPADRYWGEPDDGSLVDLGPGTGRGTESLPGDATWFHTEYWPDTPPFDHGENPDGTQRFTPGGLGYWDYPGAMQPDAGQTDGRVTRPAGASVGTAPNDFALDILDDFVVWSSPGMAVDVQRWNRGQTANFGWFILGDESIVGKKVSSKRGFASREYDDVHGDDPWEVPSSPTLTVQYTLAPDSARVAGARLFYNDSLFDGNDAQTNGNDDGAVAPDKHPLEPGGTASFDNISSYERGINGIMIDLVDRPDAPIDLNDFLMQVGKDQDPSTWQTAPQPANISVRSLGDVDRVSIVWADDAIGNEWLRVVVLPGLSTGVPESVEFYFGHALGETANTIDGAIVNAADVIAVAHHARGPNNPAPIDDPFDVNRDGRVDSRDIVVVRNHGVSPLSRLAALDLSEPSVAPAPVPEPTSGVLVLLGLSGYAAFGRRRRRT